MHGKTPRIRELLRICCLELSLVSACNTCLSMCSYSCGFCYFKALNQNAELRSRLNRIHSESTICDHVVSVNIIPSPDEVRAIISGYGVPFLWPLSYCICFPIVISYFLLIIFSLCVRDSSVVFEVKRRRWTWYHLFSVVTISLVYFYVHLTSSNNLYIYPSWLIFTSVLSFI